MGFWQTGYMDFHEFSGLGNWKPSPPIYRCAHCEGTFPSSRELGDHRFHAHPLRRPVLLIDGREIGTHPLRITSALKPKDVRIDGDRAWLNGAEIPVAGVPAALVRVSSDVVRLALQKRGVDAMFELDFRLATTRDLEGVEAQFRRTASGRKLDTRVVEEFISASSSFRTAIGYCDGICTYLYGVLAKEHAPDSTLSHEAYAGRFSKAAEELAVYERALARTIGSLIEFHFNHFSDATRLATPASRVGGVAGRYAAWLESAPSSVRPWPAVIESLDPLEEAVTDRDTEQILRCVGQPLSAVATRRNDVEDLLRRDLVEFDKVKVHMLLTEMCLAIGDSPAARQHARTLRNVPTLERWSENIIKTLSRDDHERA